MPFQFNIFSASVKIKWVTHALAAMPLFIVVALFFIAAPSQAQTKARMDLDDLMIKGEIHNDDRLMILARQKNELKNFVKFRTSFKEEMLQELPVPHPKRAF